MESGCLVLPWSRGSFSLIYSRFGSSADFGRGQVVGLAKGSQGGVREPRGSVQRSSGYR
jgi:hypothetical protein